MSIDDVYRLVMSEAAQLKGKYKADARQNLDLLFYVNLQRVMGLEDGPRPSIAALHAEGWRSVSFLKGAATSCVMFARKNAPVFLRDREGKLFHGDVT
jgi:hypothetical protein